MPFIPAWSCWRLQHAPGAAIAAQEASTLREAVQCYPTRSGSAGRMLGWRAGKVTGWQSATGD
jgi:hypothetical protein